MVSENALPLGKNSVSILKEHAQTFTVSVCFITFAKTFSGQRAEPQMQRSGFCDKTLSSHHAPLHPEL